MSVRSSRFYTVNFTDLKWSVSDGRNLRTSSDVAEEPAAAQGRGSGSGRLRSVSDETFNVADEPRPPPQTAAAA